MIDIPPQELDKFFDSFIKRGTVLRVERYPLRHTAPRDKYLVVLNLELSPGCDVCHFLATSQVEKVRSNSVRSKYAVFLPRGTTTVFPIETAIECREPYNLPYDSLKRRYAESFLTFPGDLPGDVMDRIDEIVRFSPYISTAVRRKILREI